MDGADHASVLQRPSELARRHDSSELGGGFVLGRSLPVEPSGWRSRELLGWRLLHDLRLPAGDLLDAGGMVIGWLLGHPLDLEAATPLAGARVPMSRDAPGFQAQLDDWLHGFGGRFAAVLLAPVPLLYPDAGGTLPVLFDPELQAAASSPFLLVREGEKIPDSELVDTVAVFRTGGWFTLGATPHARASLLLPNHVLDLRTWKQARVWPRERPEEADVASSVERVAVALERTLVAAAATGKPNIGFTAGGDSRTFVACARDILDRFRFVTVAFLDELGAVDLATAPALAQRLGLEHRVLPWLEPSADDVELFMYRTGCLVGESRGRLAGPSYDQFGGTEAYVSGIGAEMARGIGWRRDDEPGSELSPDALLSRFHVRPHPELLRRAGEWLAELPPGFDALDALTIFHVEMRMGGWGGPLTAGFPDAYTFTLYPFADRTIVDTVLRLPWWYRRAGRLREDVIAVRWPELLEVRINRPPARIVARRKVRRGYVAARTAAGSLRRARGRRRA